jgi:tyrosine-protein kinase Etk/Wzc
MSDAVNKVSPENYEIHLLDYLIILAKRSRMIIYSSAAVTIVCYMILFILPNQYTATARLLPPQQNLTLSAQLMESMRGGVSPGNGAAGGRGEAGALAASLLGLRSPVDLYIDILTSDTVSDQIIDRFHLMKVYRAKYRVDAQRALNRNVNITTGKKAPIIIIEATSENPKMAAEIANAYIDELSRLLQELAVQEAKGRLAFLEKERQQASDHLTKAEESMRTFSEKNGVLQIDTQTRSAIEYIGRLRAEIDTKEVGIKVLRQQATPSNYDVVRIQTEINGLKDKLRAAESQWENIISDVCMPTSRAPTLGLDYLRLFREVKFQENLYQLFAKMVEIARMDMVRDVAVVQVLDPAKPPERKSSKRLIPSLTAGMFTFFLMVIVAFGQEYIQNIKNREDDARRLLIMEDYLRPWKDMMNKITAIMWFKRKR